ncbi:transcription factor NAI1-like isoform X2 [Vigna unguiculata]|uniref:Transcription factor MYC2 n=1 Tax=Vigna unguiculata TaxID=3917 RepID=A0A4D6NEY3_VIGUN|nr:transcription factor NAI1-like isoform X2 [Vigna unguiculata]QCE12443.1 transcription factor MYC2 [Vigna unguiculata]
MEDSLENWISNLEMEDYDAVLSESNVSFDEQQFLREILEEPQNLSPSNSSVSFDEAIGDTLHKSYSSNSIKSLKTSSSSYGSAATRYLLSFDTSTAEPITDHKHGSSVQGCCSKKRGGGAVVKDGAEFEAVMAQPRKRVRRSCETQHHIMAERKRRQELTGSIIALSATIPGLKRMDKAYVLREAVNYTRQLQERVKELENQNSEKKVVHHSSTLVTKSQVSSSNKSSETNKESLFEVEARVLDEEVLIGIHCEKQKDIVCNILAFLEKLHLSPTSSSVLPFGTSTLIIHIISQMDEECRMNMDELVKNMREYLLDVYDMQQ